VKQQKGFTLVETIIAMAIVAIIVGVGWPQYVEQSRVNNRTEAIIATSAVALALDQFASDNVAGYVWSVPPTPVTAANAHNRYIPQVNVGPDSTNGTLNATCTRDRGFRWVAADNRYESCNGNYSIAVVIAADANGNPTYNITTTAIVGRRQNKDGVGDDACNAFTLDNNGVRGHIAIRDPLTVQATANNADGPLHSTRKCWGSD